MPDFQLGPWPKGIDNISDIRHTAEGAVVDAVNGWFQRGGAFTRRFNETLRDVGGIHSGWESSDGRTYAVMGSGLYRLHWGVSLVPVLIYNLPSTEPLSFTELNDEIVFSSTSVLGIIGSGDLVRLVGVEETGGFGALPAASGGLDAGRYGVAISYVAGNEEGPLSDIQFVDVPAGGGIQFSLPTPIEGNVTGIRLYRTPWNGDTLYHAFNVPLVTSALLGVDNLGSVAQTQFLRRMAGGNYVREWSGRLVVARGHVVLISEPMRYGLRSARYGFVQMPERITFMEAMAGGIYVGTTKKVYWLAGTQPKELQLSVVDERPPVEGASLVMSSADTGIETNADTLAVWLGANGYCFGDPKGSVARPVSTIFKLDTLGMTGKLALVDGVLTTVVH